MISISLKAQVAPPPRTPPAKTLPGIQKPVTLKLQSCSGSFSWGSSPGTASLVYVGSAPVLFGSSVAFNIGVNYFIGICKSCAETQGTGSGQTWLLEFEDVRKFLQWDFVFCAFNKPDIRLVAGTRVKRYKHLLPVNFDAWFWTYTNSPLQGWQILQYMMGANTVGTPWTWDLTDRGLFPAGVLSGPCIDLDFTGGRRLDAALNELCAKAGGVVFTLIASAGNPYHLVFSRKGYLGLTGLPAWVLQDDARNGLALSENPTNIRVLGERNLYQVMSVPLVPDWSAAWNVFLVFEQFADTIYQLASNPNTGIRFNQTPDDPEQYIGRQWATAYANEITVRDFVALLNANSAGTGDPFNDTRKFNGRARALMPGALYLQQLVFRLFKPSITTFQNKAGKTVPLDALNLADNLLCRVGHNAETGAMTYDVTQPTDDNGYAIVKGYQIMPELLRMVKSDQFNVGFFKDANRAWGKQGFQIDDSGEGNRFLVFDEPLVVSDNLLVTVNAHVVVNAAATLNVPAAQAALCFLAEPYSYWKGTYPNVSRDHCENVSGLNAEYVVDNSGPLPVYAEVKLANGQTADQAADEIANFLLLRQYWYYEGGLTHRWDGKSPIETFGTQLSSLLDRIGFTYSTGGGINETIDLTNERRRDNFEPERELERRTLQNSLFPGQAELKQKAELLRQNALAMRQLPKPIKDLFTKFLSGGLAADGQTTVTYFKGAGTNGTGAPSGTLPAGSVIRRQPTAQSSGQNINTVPDFAPVLSGGADKRTVFMGVLPVHNVDATKQFTVQTGGPALAQVKGPVAVNDPVGLSVDGSNYLIDVVTGTSAGLASVGLALEAIVDTSTKLIKVQLGSGGAAGGGGGNGWL